MSLRRAFVFPGQGSQKTGMGKKIAEHFAVAREVFAEVDEALGQNLSALMFDGTQEELTLTENAQPAIMANSIAIWRVMQQELGTDITRDAAFVAGHSLGEYSALVAAGALPLGDAARVLQVRAQAMQTAAPDGGGAMAAIMGLDYETLLAITQKAEGDGVCRIANINSQDQIVISGMRKNVLQAMDLCKEISLNHDITIRTILLDVSAPFHCPLMSSASEAIRPMFEAITLKKPMVDIISNVTAKAENDPKFIADLLIQQVVLPVRWLESIQYMIARGVTEIVEVGNGTILTNLIKRIDPAMNAYAINGIGHLQQTVPASLISEEGKNANL